jgi:hypothetical protein
VKGNLGLRVNGHMDALGILAEMTGMDIPVAVLPFVNAALASRVAFEHVHRLGAMEGGIKAIVCQRAVYIVATYIARAAR